MDKHVWARFAVSGPGLERHRQSIRLPEHDYSQAGVYYLTICTYERQCLFGEIVDGTMRPNDRGRIVEQEWLKSAQMRSELELDAFVVMPNHLHGIVVMDPACPPVGAHGVRPDAPVIALDAGGGPGAPTEGPGARLAPLRRAPHSLGAFVAGFKSSVTRRVNEDGGMQGVPVWQRNYHERIIRNDENWYKARLYIVNNPARWRDDINNPAYEPPGP